MSFPERPVRVLPSLGYPGGLERLRDAPQELEVKRQEIGIVRMTRDEGIAR